MIGCHANFIPSNATEALLKEVRNGEKARCVLDAPGGSRLRHFLQKNRNSKTQNSWSVSTAGNQVWGRNPSRVRKSRWGDAESARRRLGRLVVSKTGPDDYRCVCECRAGADLRKDADHTETVAVTHEGGVR